MGAPPVGEPDDGTGGVNEQLLAGAVHLAHRALELASEASVVLAELCVAIGLAVGVVGAVFLPQQHQRRALAPQFLLPMALARLYVIARPFRRDQQTPFQRRFVGIPHGRPIAPCGGCQANVFGEGALGNAQRGGDLPKRQFGVELPTQHIFYLTHIDPRYEHARQKPEAYPFGCYMSNIVGGLRHRSGIATGHSGIVPTDSGIVTSHSSHPLKLGHVGPKRVGAIRRSGWAR